MTDIVVVLTTLPDNEQASALAKQLVDERLAACVNLQPAMTSFYRWKGAIEAEAERQLVVKTTRARVPALQARLRELHPYQLPELLVLSVAQGGEDYLRWVDAETRPG
jgi:periplasmic divalent cation tolerance protein